MFKNSSSIDLTPISSRKSAHISKTKPFCPSLFLNSIDSLPKKFEEQQKEKERALELEIPDDIIVPKTVRRRHALGNSDSPQKSEQILPNLPHFSLHLSSSRKLIEDLHQFQEAETQRESYKFENINQRIRQIINSNKRQVSFQSQLIIIDDKDKSQSISELPTIRENTRRKKTHFKHLTTEI